MEWMEVLTKTLDYLEEHLLDRVSPQELAESYFVSGFYFQKGFKILTGYTIAEYVRYRRLYLAALEITAGNEKVIDLAYKYGYETPESFARAFRRFHGVSPAQLRHRKDCIKTFLPLSVSIAVKGGARLDYVVEAQKEFTVVGVERRVDFVDAYETIPQYWNEIYHSSVSKRLHEQPTNFRSGCFGVSIENKDDRNSFTYMIAGKYQGGPIPEGCKAFTVPALTWAKFQCTGPLPGAFQTVNTRVFREWIPAHPEYGISAGINVELYREGDIRDRQYKSEVWIPVRKRGS